MISFCRSTRLSNTFCLILWHITIAWHCLAPLKFLSQAHALIFLSSSIRNSPGNLHFRDDVQFILTFYIAVLYFRLCMSITHSRNKMYLLYGSFLVHSEFQYTSRPPTLHVDRVDPSNIEQGELGDCWFLSVLGVLAARPHLIDRVLLTKEANQQGAYAVQFNHNGIQAIVGETHWVHESMQRICNPPK